MEGDGLSEPKLVLEVGSPCPDPLAPRAESDLTRSWTDGEPLVSILCPTYQHVDFIADAFHGFLGQMTTFPFEVIARDDASTDGTAELVKDFAGRFPNVVRAVLETENQFARTRPIDVLWPMARGAFVAICEGDDYWTDPGGLQALVDALLSHPGASAAHHGVVHVRNGFVARPSDSRLGSSLTQRELLSDGAFSLRSTLVRNDPLFRSEEFFRYARRVWAFDRLLANAAGALGDLVFVPGVTPAVYRLHGGGISSDLREDAENRSLQKAADRYWTAMFLQSIGEEEAATIQMQKACERLLRSPQERPSTRLRIGLHLVFSGLRSLRAAGLQKARLLVRAYFTRASNG